MGTVRHWGSSQQLFNYTVDFLTDLPTSKLFLPLLHPSFLSLCLSLCFHLLFPAICWPKHRQKKRGRKERIKEINLNESASEPNEMNAWWLNVCDRATKATKVNCPPFFFFSNWVTKKWQVDLSCYQTLWNVDMCWHMLIPAKRGKSRQL